MNPNQLLKSGSPTARRAGTPKQSIDLQANKSENWKIEQPEWFRPVENVTEIDHKPVYMGFASGDMIIQNDEPVAVRYAGHTDCLEFPVLFRRGHAAPRTI